LRKWLIKHDLSRKVFKTETGTAFENFHLLANRNRFDFGLNKV
jgi:hypothetical protein